MAPLAHIMITLSEGDPLFHTGTPERLNGLGWLENPPLVTSFRKGDTVINPACTT